jgi:hypothetical protein
MTAIDFFRVFRAFRGRLFFMNKKKPAVLETAGFFIDRELIQRLFTHNIDTF